MRRQFLIAAALLLGACSQETATSPASDAPLIAAEPAAAEPVNQVAEKAPPEDPAEPLPAPAQPVAANPDPAPPVQQPAAERDARLVGIWVNEDIINSGGGDFASYTTVMTLELYPDGRAVQYTESIGGGGDWSYDGGRTIDFDGQWRADGQTFYVYAAPLPDFTPAATYSFSGEYLVTQSDMGRLIWQRRG
ncbi:hypothetical protein [Hyphomonas sp.]|jgi:hypothetical protein|uniref:hypothetical protein n=1 Tax=Hyphomonas sp. TaxID=87 RepID=UPI0037BF17BD